MVYAPALHNALGRFREIAISRPGVFAFDPAGGRLAISDLSERPDLWESSLSQLSSTIHQIVLAPVHPATRLRDRDPLTADLILELIGHFRREYLAFLDRHADTPIPRPASPEFGTDDDQRRSAETIGPVPAMQPTFGARYRKRYESDAATFDRYEAELQ